MNRGRIAVKKDFWMVCNTLDSLLTGVGLILSSVIDSRNYVLPGISIDFEEIVV